MTVTRELLKGLFAQLVSECKGVENAGAVLGISFQRVSQLQSLATDFEPNLLKHIVPLEQFVGRPIVTGYLANLSGGKPANDAMEEAVEASVAAGRLLSLVHGGAPLRDVAKAVSELTGEANDCLKAAEAKA